MIDYIDGPSDINSAKQKQDLQSWKDWQKDRDIVEEVTKAINRRTQERPKKRRAPNALSSSCSNHGHLTSYVALCYEGNDNKGRMEDPIMKYSI